MGVTSGKAIAYMTDKHRAVEFRSFLNLIIRSVPEDLDVHLVVDNYATHKSPRSSGGSSATHAPSPFHIHVQLVAQPH